MLQLFRNQNPYTIIGLAVLVLLLKIPAFLSPQLPHVEEYQVLWKLVLNAMYAFFGKSPFIFTLITCGTILAQGIFLNQIVNNYHFYTKRNYLPAYSYCIISCLLPEWQTLSVELFNNWLILIFLNLIYQTYSDQNTRKVLFNVGFSFGLLTLFNLPNAWLLFFVAFSVSMLRAYKPAEWMVTLLGIITPMYLLVGMAYLFDSMFIVSKIFSMPFSTRVHWSLSEIVGIGLLIVFTTIGILLILKKMSRMLFQIKKMWWVNFILLAVTLVSTLGLYTHFGSYWIILCVPATLFISKIWNIEKPKWIPELLNLVFLSGIVYLNWL